MSSVKIKKNWENVSIGYVSIGYDFGFVII